MIHLYGTPEVSKNYIEAANLIIQFSDDYGYFDMYYQNLHTKKIYGTRRIYANAISYEMMSENEQSYLGDRSQFNYIAMNWNLGSLPNRLKNQMERLSKLYL